MRELSISFGILGNDAIVDNNQERASDLLLTSS
jgi:hypothetical protein